MIKRVVLVVMLASAAVFSLNANAIEFTAEAAVAIDSVTGAVLIEKNAHTPLGMASTTKIMTGILAIENGNLDDIVTISENASGVEGSSIYLQPNEKISLETLVYGLLLKSGNDAAVAIAEYIGGSEKAFVKMMNDKAKELNLENTSFVNPHGLYNENHYTTAYDLALIARYAMSNSLFAKIVNTANYTETPPEARDGRTIFNANKLISMYSEADGVKPGYTPETGRTLVGSATRNGWRIITVTLNCKDDWNEHKSMFDEVFKNYSLQKVVEKGSGIGTYRVKGGIYNEVGVIAANDVYAPVKNGGSERCRINVDIKTLTAPVVEGQIVDSAEVMIAEGVTAKVDLCTNGGVEIKSKNVFNIVWELVLALFGVKNVG